ncbi:MAG: response regulator [Ferrovibrio sp.]|uniref:response regulator n=1 Tax=Ferrovibrio sp. TaxID=1917215 RepID=UPI00260BB09A|nr:response regulator [Ferrovibrio sp.]MCW0235676.1 response regulator [Ferrovibrio sp.]
MMASARDDRTTAEAGDDRAVVLVVEDEVLVRMVIAEYLRDCGYVVIEAGNAKEAVALFQADIEVDVVFTDVQMPGEMDGFGLARWVRQTRPGVDVIITSGAAKAADAAAGLCEDGPFMQKPYEAEDVIRRIRQLLAARAGKAGRDGGN